VPGFQGWEILGRRIGKVISGSSIIKVIFQTSNGTCMPYYYHGVDKMLFLLRKKKFHSFSGFSSMCAYYTRLASISYISFKVNHLTMWVVTDVQTGILESVVQENYGFYTISEVSFPPLWVSNLP